MFLVKTKWHILSQIYRYSYILHILIHITDITYLFAEIICEMMRDDEVPASTHTEFPRKNASRMARGPTHLPRVFTLRGRKGEQASERTA